MSNRTTFDNPSTRAFSLIELCLWIAIIGVLLSLFASKVLDFRDASRRSVQLQSLQQHAAIVAGTYTQDWKSYFPWVLPPTPGRSTVKCTTNGYSEQTEYFGTGLVWQVALADVYYGGDPWQKSLRSPLAPQDQGTTGPFPAHYVYPCVFIARPEYYNLFKRLQPAEQYRPTSQADVLYPDRKTVLVSRFAFAEPPDHRTPEVLIDASFIDGHAESTKARERHREAMNDGQHNEYGAHWGGHELVSMLHTFDGVRGSDVRGQDLADVDYRLQQNWPK